jgi:hypothetical protein
MKPDRVHRQYCHIDNNILDDIGVVRFWQ